MTGRTWKIGCGICALTLLAVLLLAGGCGVRYWRQGYGIPRSARQIRGTAAQALGPRVFPVTCPTPDGTYAPGWFAPGTNRKAVVLLHGLGGTREQLAGIGRFLNQNGYGVLLIDQRGHGEHPLDITTFGRAEAYDALGAVQWLRTRDDVDPMRIGLYGASMGAVTAIHAAALDDHLGCLVADSAYAVFREQVKWDMGYENNPIKVPARWRPIVSRLFCLLEPLVIGDAANWPDPLDSVGKVKCPVFIIHGENDARIPSVNLDYLTQAATEAGIDVTSWKVAGAGHCDYHGSTEFRSKLLNFLSRNL